jgi:leucyl aminopeptidase
MKYSIKTEGSSQIMILPIEQGENYIDRMERVAERAGLDRIDLEADFKANAKESQLLYTASSTRLYLLGLGKNPKNSDFLAIFKTFFKNNKSKLVHSVGIDLTNFSAENIGYILNGIVLGGYSLGDLHKTDIKKEANFYDGKNELTLYVSAKNFDEAYKNAQIGYETGLTQLSILDLVNQPSNFKYPTKLGEFAQESGAKSGYSVVVYNEQKCLEKGLHALLSVGKGSENPSVFIVMEYKGENPKKKIGLVGKGVTFDTGGISIKSSNGMSYMKSDMGGAAAVIGTMEMAAKLQLPIHLIGIVPSCENTVDGLAIKPSFVIPSYAGKTIEVIDTDAEGRLILADGLAYMKKNYEPDIMIDLATLTGNIIAALGYSAAGLFTKNQTLANELIASGQDTGEKLWQMPMFDEFADAMKSDVADIKNLSSNPVAGAATATKFLEAFTGEHTAWAHLDIAGTAFGDNENGSMKSATAFGVNLLTNWLRKI